MTSGRGMFYVYRNLVTGGYSIRRSVDGITRVIGHCKEAWLLGVQFRVSLAGWRRAHRTQQRNVHAYAVAAMVALPGSDDYWRISQQMMGFAKRDVSYDPFGPSYFFIRGTTHEGVESQSRITAAPVAQLTEIGLHVFGATKG